ncbi:hypothetical protein [Paraconexibacter sp.]|uniref:hypothetical protein n=1 Tax=Paraconexibacter sp. TaxID=2949640 RepID=UPI003568C906
MAASRPVPTVGGPAHIRRLNDSEPVTVVAVRGPLVTVEHADGRQSTFELHRGKGHFYLEGAGSTGPRLVL